jgi:hypothetical protein
MYTLTIHSLSGATRHHTAPSIAAAEDASSLMAAGDLWSVTSPSGRLLVRGVGRRVEVRQRGSIYLHRLPKDFSNTELLRKASIMLRNHHD